MGKTPNAAEVLDREFLEIRAGLLTIAAQLDRLDRAGGALADDPRIQNVRRALEVLASDNSARAERVQLIFSRQYDSKWKENLQMAKR